MNATQNVPDPQDRRERAPAQDDAFDWEFDDAALERALKTVSWNPKDVGQFLRAAASR